MESKIYFNPLDLNCKSVIGGIKTGETLTLQIFLVKNGAMTVASNGYASEILRTPPNDACEKPQSCAFLQINRDGEPPESLEMEIAPYGWRISFQIQETGLYFYHFYIENRGFVSCGDLNTGYLTNSPNAFLLTVSDTSYQTPAWIKGGTMYQIFPDRFAKTGSMPVIEGRILREDWGGLPSFLPNENGKVLNNDFFGGNFRGIQSKLPYLSDLGVTVIYLNPIFEAWSNHRYDTADYMRIDPMLGTEEEFSETIKTAENYGIQVILDGVFNHTGDNSVYFNKYGNYPNLGAYQSKESPYYSWYSFSEFPNKYESWWGIDILPEINETSESYQEFIFGEKGVLKKWLNFGIGGYRLDVADELPDFFLKKLRKSVKESNPDAIIIGEVWEDASNKIAYSKRREYLHGYELDSVMNYPLKEAIIRYMQTGLAKDLLHTIRILIDHYPKETTDCLMNILGTHDTARILTVLGGIYCANKEEMSKDTAYLSKDAKRETIERLKTAAVLQFTLPGIPCIYYGDENGAEGHIDPFCRQCFNWNDLNEDLIGFYRRLGQIRKEYREIFKDGEFIELRTEDGLFYYKRQNGYGSVYIYTNHSSKRYAIDLSGEYLDLLQNKKITNRMEIQPYSFGIFSNSKIIEES